MLKNKFAFLNNIIISLPDDIQFLDSNNSLVELKSLNEHATYTMEMPDRMNSICIIDGQHRIYAHYESLKRDSNELQMERMRKRLHLLVTGIVYPKEMQKNERVKFESKIFLDINTNAKPVTPEVLNYIETMAKPLSANGLARTFLEKMNKKGPLARRLETSSLETGKIKTSSIVKYALNKLVDIETTHKYFFYYWDGDKEKLINEDEVVLMAYTDYCVSNLNAYFNAIKDVFNDEWNDRDSKLLSILSINGFIIAYGYCIEEQGIKSFEFYKNSLSQISCDFSKYNFPYSGSRYKKFASEIIIPVFTSTK